MQVQRASFLYRTCTLLESNDRLCYFLVGVIVAGFVMVEYKSGRPKNEKILSSGLMVLFVAVSVATFMFGTGNFVYGGNLWKYPISFDSVIRGLHWTWTSFRWGEPLLFSVPVMISIYLAFRKHLPIRREPLLLAIYSILSIFAIASFTSEGSFPYRILPNAVLILYACSSILYDVGGAGIGLSQRK